MRNIRVFYQKVNRVKYLSHLDLMRSMMRALKMSGIDVKYTQGYNPRIYLTFALPLSLGYEGLRESMDFDILDENITLAEIKEKLEAVFPKSIPLLEVALVKNDSSHIKYADYKISYYLEDRDANEEKSLWENLFKKEEIKVERKSKKKLKIVDIKPDIISYHIGNIDDEISLEVRVFAGISYNVNPRLLVKAFEKENEIKINPNYKRVQILDSNQELFR